MRAAVEVRLTFEAAHRLPALGGQCANLHGHSWSATFTIGGWVDDGAIVADLGVVKAVLRGWIDRNLDHGCLLGIADPLIKPLEAEDCRLYVFGEPDGYVPDLAWPTTEAVAILLHRIAGAALPVSRTLPPLDVISVRVTEAPSIAAVYP